MKKIILVFLPILLFAQVATSSAADTHPRRHVELMSNQDAANLALLGRIWGLLKYHHPAVVKGNYNWDEELVKFLPAYRASHNSVERNQLLLKWVKSYGEVPAATPVPDSLMTNVKLKPDLSWIDQNKLTPELSALLKQISGYHSPADQRYVKFLEADNVVLPSFINEDGYPQMSYPVTEYRILAVYRYWNIIEYWYPYKYLTKQKWDDCLDTFIKEAVEASNELDYVHFVQRMIGSIQDSHAVTNSKKIQELKGNWLMPFSVKFIQGQAVVNSIVADQLHGALLEPGDVIKTVNGTPIAEFIKKNEPYVAASNKAIVLREIARLLNRSTDSVAEVTVTGKTGTTHTEKLKNIPYKPTSIVPVYDFPYQRDSSCFMLAGGVIYVNPGKFKDDQVNWVKDHLTNAKGLILDARQYPRNGSGPEFNLLQNYLIAGKGAMSKFSTAVKGYPGLFRYVSPFVIGQVNANYFKGKVVILVNEGTQSASEFMTMGYQLLPNAIVVGSTTAGADGNVSYTFQLPGGIYTMITGLGVYYADGRETQQVGIVPNIKVELTIKGFRNHQDELLDKAVNVILGK